MNELEKKGKLQRSEIKRGRNLKAAAIITPIALTAIPIGISAVMFVLFASNPPAAATILFFGFLFTILGFVKGLAISGIFGYKYSNWKKDVREQIAAGGISADELDWFRHELKANEKRALRELNKADPLLLDAYRDTLASRLTATRIIKSTRRELQVTERRKLKLRDLKTEVAGKFRDEIARDVEKIKTIQNDAKEMLVEAESRLQMIEAASLRGGSLADSELALRVLNARAASLPLALEEAKLANEIAGQLNSESFSELDGKASD